MGVKLKRTVSLTVTLCILLSLLVSCGGKEKYTEHYFDLFDTVTTVVGYADSRAEFDEVCRRIISELEEYHCLFDIYNKYEGLNNVASLNEVIGGKHPTLEVDPEIVALLEFSADMHGITDGRTNVAMGSVLSLWHTCRTDGLADPALARLPGTEELERASRHTDINDVIIDGNTVTIADPELTLDVGAVAKGYAVRRVCEKLRGEGVDGYVISVGGSVSCIGDACGKPWRVGVEDPTSGSDGGYALMLEVSDVSVVTSGSYQRYYTVDGKNYHHIIDSETLMPAEGLLSVTVISQDPALADALSTALFCMSIDEGLALVGSVEDAEALWIKEDGEHFYSDGAKKYLEG